MTTSPRAHLTRWVLPLLAGALALVGLPTQAAHASSAITGVKVLDVTHTSFTVRLDSQGDGWKYRLFAAPNNDGVFYDRLSQAPYQSSLRSKPRLTLTGLPYRTAAYFYRVQAVKNGHFRTGSIRSLGLRPDDATGLTVNTVAAGGLSLTWNGSSNGWQVQQATDPGFTTGVHTYPIRGLGHQFTPPGLTSGGVYSFRVRASNLGTKSAWTPGQIGTVASQLQTARVGDFNIHDIGKTGNTLPGWGVRRPAVVQSIRDGKPEVLAIAEGGAAVDGTRCGKRQAEDLVDALGGAWKLADTEAAPCTGAGWVRTGVYVIYDSSVYRAVGASGHWQISPKSQSKRWWAAYQVMENKTTGAQFLFVSTHLIVGNKDALDKERAAETQNLLDEVDKLGLDLPVVYAGDFNSHERRPFDGPGVTMRAAGVADAFFVSQHRVNKKYNSANNYQRKPPSQGVSIDHVYGSPGVALQSWELIMKLKNGEYDGVIPSDHNMLLSDIVYPY
jgi:endonuclease/exonuclease/phosphatase family metal-dependent hydrolase